MAPTHPLLRDERDGLRPPHVIEDVSIQIRTADDIKDPQATQVAESLEHAVASAGHVQKNGTERPQIKHMPIPNITAIPPDHPVIATSSTAATANVIAKAFTTDKAVQMIVGHPFIQRTTSHWYKLSPAKHIGGHVGTNVGFPLTEGAHTGTITEKAADFRIALVQTGKCEKVKRPDQSIPENRFATC